MPSRGGFVRIPRGPACFGIELWPAVILLVRIRKRHPLWALSPPEKNPDCISGPTHSPPTLLEAHDPWAILITSL